jgi:hypothetical protein
MLCAFAAALIAFGVIRWPKEKPLETIAGASIMSRQPIRFESTSKLDFPQRRLYPYSVIPGGVESAQELRNAIANDPLVAELYANFDLSRAHIVRLKKDQLVYVSYRLGGRIYWTKKRLLLRAGETIITDGAHEGRTRCGNRVSETPKQPVAHDEPPNSAMNAPATTALLAENAPLPSLPMVDSPTPDPVSPGLPLMPQPPSSPPVDVIPPLIFPIVGGGPPSFPNVIPPPPPPPVSTPEPGTLPLLGVSLLLLAGVAGMSRIRKASKS